MLQQIGPAQVELGCTKNISIPSNKTVHRGFLLFCQIVTKL